ncbi:hypothetical protein Rhopal_000534-T1 [Rhodotorula paludigena]|uniref:Uncharacterized protein n=1 Tax=Rhodotorula paludigena TaxID=86838 RepID=A0AAV5GCW1_9BASI|nr:hypothetical protein Rhopal_000534-T1 [Rhodotorula paludigena]
MATASTPSHLAQASTASPTSSTPAPSRSRPSDAASKSSQSTQKRPRPRPPKSRLQGSWLPNLTSRSGTGRGKIAAFDLDGTVIQPRNGQSFPRDSNDWEFCGPNVVSKLRETHNAGYSLILISNQASPMPRLAADFRKKLPHVCRKINVPLRVFACWEFDEYRKPAPAMWTALLQRFNGDVAVDYAQSYYVGDAAGRAADHADTDLKFALNAGLRFLTPEQFFLGAPSDPTWTLWGWHPHAHDHTTRAAPEQVSSSASSAQLDPASPEIVLLVGGPAAGKTHLWREQYEPLGYQRFTFAPQQNSLPSSAALSEFGTLVSSIFPASSDAHLALSNTSTSTLAPCPGIVVDALLPTRRSRTSFLRLIHSLAPSARVRCVVLSTFGGAADDLELGKHNAVYRLAHGTAEEAREGLTPLPVLRKWEREYEEPSLAEGFTHLNPQRFSFSGPPDALARWQQWLADVYPGKAKKSGRVAVRGPGA